MRHSIIAFFSAVLTTAIFAPAVQAQAPVRVTPSAELQNYVRNSYIFQFDYQVLPDQVRGRAAALVSEAGGQIGHVYNNSIMGFSAHMSSVAAAILYGNYNDIASYSRDGIATIVQASPKRGKPENPGGGGGGGGDPVGPTQITPWGIDRVGGTADGSGKTAWIIDTGIDLDHPDLNVNTAMSISFVSKGKDASNPDDQNGHGTHVAGTIAAKDNDIGVVGVAAGATVVSVRVLDKRGSGAWSDVIAGIDYVAANGNVGDVVNMSLGGPENGAVTNAVIAAANGDYGEKILFSLAAGNESINASLRSPASAEGDGIYTVSAIKEGDGFASFSNYGNPPVDYAAPGVSVESTSIGSGTSTKSGTSMAAPHVAGILLLGGVKADGTASGDPDGNPDPIAHR